MLVSQIYQNYQNAAYLPLFPEDKLLLNDPANPVGPTLESKAGRILWYNGFIECVGIKFDYWGTSKTMLVPVAKYRTSVKLTLNASNAGNRGSDISNTALGTSAVKASSITSPIPVITDIEIRSKYSILSNDPTGRAMSTAIANSTNRNAVAHAVYCRNLKLPNLSVGYFDCPNFYEAYVIFAESDNIDLLDPTADEYPGKKLGYTNPNAGRFWINNAYDMDNGAKRMLAATTTERSGGCIHFLSASGAPKMLNYNYSPNCGVIPCRVL